MDFITGISAKSIFTSKTFWGAVIAAAAVILRSFWGVELDPDTQLEVVNGTITGVSTVGVLVGSALAVYGRVKASGPAKFTLRGAIASAAAIAQAVAVAQEEGKKK